MFIAGVHQELGLSSYFVVIKQFKLVLIDSYCYHDYEDENCKQCSFRDVNGTGCKIVKLQM